MKFAFAGAIHPVLQQSILNLGHETYYGHEIDWYRQMQANKSPEEWADNCQRAILKEKPDVFVLCKGLILRDGGNWVVPLRFLWWVKKHVKCMVFLSFDCPASTPLYIKYGILAPFDLFGTTCVGISSLFKEKLPKKTKIFEFWLGFNQNLGENIPVLPLYECDLAITGTPYYKPFEPPHYRGGFGFPRGDFVNRIMDKNPEIKILLYGPPTWLDKEKGGSPRFKDIYHGWVPEASIHLAHRAAKVCLGTQLVQGYRYESGRCVWVGGAGGFLMHEDRPGLRETFGNSVLWFNTGDMNHAHKQLIMALQNPGLRKEMAGNLKSIVWQGHTWYHRAQSLIAESGLYLSKHGKKPSS